MVNLEEIMTNLKESKTPVNLGDIRTLTWENVAIGAAIRGVMENYIA